MRIVVATRNPGKLAELRRLLVVPGLEIVGVGELGVGMPEVEETEETYVGNAILKARAIASVSGAVALADDSGLEVDALGGAPGVRSARYAGRNAGSRANVDKLLHALQGVPEGRRSARFRCAVAVVGGSSTAPLIAEGTCEGTIARAPRGERGFGYDPVFEVSKDDLALLGRDVRHVVTMAELDDDEKDRISHRARAIALLASRFDHIGMLAAG